MAKAKTEEVVEETTEEVVELSVDEHNAKVAAEIKDLEEQIKALYLTFKAESEKRQVDLHDCLTKFPR